MQKLKNLQQKDISPINLETLRKMLINGLANSWRTLDYFEA